MPHSIRILQAGAAKSSEMLILRPLVVLAGLGEEAHAR